METASPLPSSYYCRTASCVENPQATAMDALKAGDLRLLSALLSEEGDRVEAVVDGVIKLGAGMTMMMMTPAEYQHLSPCPGLALELHLLPLPGLPRPLLLVARETCRVDLLDRGEQGWDKVCR